MKHWRAVTLLAIQAGALATAQSGFDSTLVVVMGGGISAGFADFHLTQNYQVLSWPCLIAGPMGTVIPAPTLRESGQAGVINSFQPLPGLLPVVAQSGERALPLPLFSLNASVPFLKLGDALRLRPTPQYDGTKLIVSIENDFLHTMVNTILGGPLLTFPKPVILSQIEYARMLNPTAVFVELGFQDVLDAALARDTSRITSTASFTSDYGQLLRMLAATNAYLVVMTVPNPADTAYFTSLTEAAHLQGLSPADLQSQLGLSSGDLLTPGGLAQMGDILRGRRKAPLSADAALTAVTAAAVHDAVNQFNQAIRSAAGSYGAAVFDLNAYLHQIRTNGATAAGVAITGTYGGGFYSEDGLFPNAIGQALIANAVLQFVNVQFGMNYPSVPVPAPAAPGSAP